MSAPSTYRDYAPETRSLLASLEAAGRPVYKANNGGDDFTVDSCASPEAFFEEIMGADECTLFVRCQDKGRWVQLVFGNGPGELVSDYQMGDDTLNMVLEAHARDWQKRPQPMARHDGKPLTEGEATDEQVQAVVAALRVQVVLFDALKAVEVAFGKGDDGIDELDEKVNGVAGGFDDASAVNEDHARGFIDYLRSSKSL